MPLYKSLINCELAPDPGQAELVEMTPEEVAIQEAFWADVAANPESIVNLRVERNRLLAESDYTQQPDSPLSDSKRKAWQKYRQELRDLPAKAKDHQNPKWPKTP